MRQASRRLNRSWRRVSAISLAALALLATAPASPAAERTGIVGDRVLSDGHHVGTIDPEQINCLGHAAKVGSAVFIPRDAPFAETLRGLGFTCQVGAHDTLRPAIEAGLDVMMVYLDMFPPTWRDAHDAGLSYEQLAARYGWDHDSWKRPFLFVSREGVTNPIDHHAIGYDAQAGRWTWVARRKWKGPNRSYRVDSTDSMPATTNPDVYFPVEQVLVSLACTRTSPPAPR